MVASLVSETQHTTWLCDRQSATVAGVPTLPTDYAQHSLLCRLLGAGRGERQMQSGATVDSGIITSPHII